MAKDKVGLILIAVLFLIPAGYSVYFLAVAEKAMPMGNSIMLMSFSLILVGLLLASMLVGARLWQEHQAKSIQFYLIAVGLLVGHKLVNNYSTLSHLLINRESWWFFSNFNYLLMTIISLLTIVVPLVFIATVVKKGDELEVSLKDNKILAVALSLSEMLKDFFGKNKIHPVVAIIAIVIPISILATEAGAVYWLWGNKSLIYGQLYQAGYVLSYLALTTAAMALYRQSQANFFLMLGLVGIAVLGLDLLGRVNMLVFQSIFGLELSYSNSSSYMAYYRLTGFITFFGALFQPLFIFLAIKNWDK